MNDNKYSGFLHPGAMGISLAATAQLSGNTAFWVSEGRSRDTRLRSEKCNMTERISIVDLCDTCSVIISVCPPSAAADVAKKVRACSFRGIYADVNAVSPGHSIAIGKSMKEAGIEYVDGGIIGGPAWKKGTTWLYVSGRSARQVAECFQTGPLETEILSVNIGMASALKMCFAANTKGTTAMLCAILAAADKLGVRNALETQWSRYDKDFSKETHDRIQRVTAKAWRFSGEMQEIASTFKEVDLPGGFYESACDIYNRISRFKRADPMPPVEDVLDALLHPERN